jgi:CheY-like chemotaxis protein
MFQKQWDVLLVDDDPDMLRVSKLAMKNFKVYGIPLKIHECRSKLEAIQLLETQSELLPSLAVAFIDVVMETDEAGLELCRYIREAQQNYLTQIYVRTGQPGVAPERAVIERYDINGYFTKIETTEDKLYSLTYSGVRQYYWSTFALGTFIFLKLMTMAAGSRATLVATAQSMVESAFADPTNGQANGATQANLCYWLDDEAIASLGWSEREARVMRDQLSRHEGVELHPKGDKYVMDDQHRLLVKIAPQKGIAAAYFVATPTFRLPAFVVDMVYDELASFARLWAHST